MSEGAGSGDSISADESLANTLVKGFIDKDGVGVDHFLQYLVSLINGIGNAEMGITLTVGGSVVSGMLISGDKYFEEFSTAFAAGFGEADESTQNIKSSVNRFGDKYRNDRASEDSVEPPVYIHLKKAKHYSAAGAIPRQHVIWRGKISAVDGFSLGIMSAD